MATISLVVGLGNPGGRYEGTRHNVGFVVVDEVARRRGGLDWVRQSQCLMARADDPLRVLLAKPQTFMNRSGSAIVAVMAAMGIAPDEVLVVVDDVDLPIARLRLRRAGGPGTHNGLRDIVDAIGPSFPRLRVGVRGTCPWEDLAEYVLAPFDEEEAPVMAQTLVRAAEAVELVLELGVERAMNDVNRAPESLQEEARGATPD